MTDSIESQARTVAEAISEALLRLGARRDEVEIEVLEEPRSGLFGFLGGRSAKVLVTRKGGGRSNGRGSRGRGRGRGRGGAAVAKTDAPVRATSRQKSDQQESSGRRSKSATKPKTATQKETDAPAERTSERARTESSRRRRPRRRKPAATETTASEQPPTTDTTRAQNQPAAAVARELETPPVSRAAPREATQETPFAANDSGRVITAEVKATEHAAAIREVDEAGVPDLLHDLATKLMRLGDFPCRCEILPGDYRLVKIITDDRSAGMLIGRHGATVDAVEHLIERMATQAHGDRVRMNLDINNYRRKREATLIELTGQAIVEVRQTGREVHTDPLCARERRIVHLEVKKAPGLKSLTKMSGDGKYVVLALDNDDATEPDTFVATAGDEQVAPENNETDIGAETDTGTETHTDQ